MAESALYGNTREPAFPYEEIAKHLAWVPQFIEGLTSKRGRNKDESRLYDALINILLVFVRARTSTLQQNSFEPICRTFARRLNQTLSLLRESDGAKHQIEIVPRNTDYFFVTCKYSPRFNWKRRLTHREVGLNLDYCAAGHIGRHSSRMKIRVFEIHTSAHTTIMDELILQHWVPNMDSLLKFLKARTALFNSSMTQLNLPYRFESIINIDEKKEEVWRAVSQSTPPSPEWWKEHYLAFRDMPYDMSFCSANSRFAHYWEVLCIVYDFDLAKRASSPPDRSWPLVEYSANVEELFNLVYTTIEGHEGKTSLSVPSPKEFERHVVARLRFLVIDPPPQPSPVRTLRKSDLNRFLGHMKEALKMQTIERWKLRNPLVYNNGVTDVGPNGHKLWRSEGQKHKSMISAVGSFLFSRYE
jgi:hypothetical protein